MEEGTREVYQKDAFIHTMGIFETETATLWHVHNISKLPLNQDNFWATAKSMSIVCWTPVIGSPKVFLLPMGTKFTFLSNQEWDKNYKALTDIP